MYISINETYSRLLFKVDSSQFKSSLPYAGHSAYIALWMGQYFRIGIYFKDDARNPKLQSVALFDAAVSHYTRKKNKHAESHQEDHHRRDRTK